MRTITILLIEDNTQDIRLIKEMLKEIRSFNYDLVLAANLKDGCKQIQKNNFDIILLDLNLPDSTGQQTFQKVIDCCKEIPVILITGNEDQELSVKLIMEGAQDYITKQSLNPAPLEKSILYSIERQVLLRNIKIQKAEITRIEKELILTAKFPAQNPGPILRVAGNGKLLYINESGIKLLPDWQLIINEIIPSRLKDIIDTIFIEGTNIKFELCHRELIYSFCAVPIIEDGYINLYGRDITERKRAEEALRETNDKLIRAQLVAHIGSWETELLNLKVVWSEETYRIFEVEPNSFISHSGFWEFVHPEDRMKVDAAFEGSIGKHSFNSIEHRIITPSGIVKFVEECWEVIYDNQGLPLRVVGTCQDITERKRAEAKLLSEQAFRKSIESSLSSGIVIVDDEGRQTYVNPSFCKLFGWTKEELEGKSAPFIYWPDDQLKYINEAFQLTISGKASNEGFELEFVNKDGVRIPTQVIISPFNNGTKRIGWLANVMDITERKLAEQALRESQTLYYSFIEQLPNAVFRKDMEGRYILINSEFCKLKGLPKEDILGKKPMEVSTAYLSDPSERKKAFNFAKLGADLHKNILDTGKTYIEEEEYLSEKGDKLYMQVLRMPVFNSSGTVIGSQGIMFDISERKQAEEKLKISFTKYQVLFDSFPLGITISDKDGNIVESNQKAEILLGLTNEEQLKRQIDGHEWSIIKTNGLPFSQEEYASVIALKENRLVENIEMGMVKGENDITWLNVTAAPIPIENYGVAIVYSDITQQKLVKEELIKSRVKVEESEKKLIEAQKTAHIGHWDWNLKKQQLNWSDEIFNIFGVSKESFPVTVENFEKTIHPDDLSDFLLKRSGTLQNGSIINIDHRIVRPNGEIRYVQELSQVLRDKDNEPISVFGTVQDITDLKLIELELIKSKEKAEESDRLKSSFLAAMSHELRTPLNAIIGFSGFLDRNLPKDDVVEFGELINSSGNHLLSIVNDIFDITLIESGQTKIIKEKINLNSMLYDVHNMAGAEKQRINKNAIELRLIPPSEEEDIMIYTDPSKLKQILINLLKNALKFTEKGHIHYGYSFESDEGKPVLRFYVEDTGIGIPEDKKEVIFDMFRQVEESLSRKYGGTGIGLSISKKLTKLLGGKIWVESEIGEGSTFYFTIPFETPVEVSNPIQKETTRNNRLEGKTILISEDDEPSFKLLKIILESSGINTLWAKNGKESINQCKENTNIDLVLMDINMPEMNGYDATREIKRFRPGLPIIAQTAHAIAGDLEKALDAGCDDYIPKPIKKERLLGLIEKHFNK